MGITRNDTQRYKRSSHKQVRWHICSDDSVLLDDDKYGQRLIMPEEWSQAQREANEHDGEMNPDSYTDHGYNSDGSHSFEISFDVPPNCIVPQPELDTWLNAECAKTFNTWWHFDR